MLSKKDTLARFLSKSCGFLLQRNLNLLRSDEFVVLTYHRILDLNCVEYPFDEDLVSASPAEFDWQMKFIAENFRPERLEVLLDMSRQNQPIPAGSVAITFDDGFLDNYTVAYPILRKYGVPATFFVTTDFVDRNQPIWFEVVCYAFLSLPVGAISDRFFAHAMPSGDAREIRLAELKKTMYQLKRAPDAERLEFVSYLHDLIDSSALSAAWIKYGGAMQWDQIREISRDIIDIGSHTISHPILSKISESSLKAEIVDSKRRLEEEIGKPVPLIAYPVGGQSQISSEVIRVATEAGYRFGITYIAG